MLEKAGIRPQKMPNDYCIASRFHSHHPYKGGSTLNKRKKGVKAKFRCRFYAL